MHETKQLHYTPDFHLIERGQHVLAECKPERFVETEENRRKFAVAGDWCEERGWEFRIITDQRVRSSLQLQNIKLLTQYARQKVDIAIRSQIHAFLQTTQAPVSVHDLACAIHPADTSIVVASIFCLAYHHEITLSLDESPISEATIVSHCSRKQNEEMDNDQATFSRGARFRWQDTTYQIARLLPGGQANIENILTGAISVVEINTLVYALFAAELHFVSDDAPVLPAAQAERRGR